jgi:plastocyanin
VICPAAADVLTCMQIKSLILPTLSAIVVAGVGYQLANHGSHTSGPVSSVPVTAHHVSVKIVNFAYAPPTLTIKVGTRVTWANKDSSPHTATSNETGFDTGSLTKGKRTTIQFNKAGTFAYHCSFHAFMTATIKVVS